MASDTPAPVDHAALAERLETVIACERESGACVMVHDPERPPCTADNCERMKQAALRAHPAGGVSEINPLALAQDYERRLDLDKDWFTSREEKKAKHMREALRAAGIGAGVDGVVISHEMNDFLHGSGPLKNKWFGELHPHHSGAYWWRRFLPRSRASTPVHVPHTGKSE